MKRRLTIGLVVLALLALFVAGGSVLRRQVPAWQPATSGGSPGDYVGDWQCGTVSLDLHIESQAQQLQVTGLEARPVVFERSSPQAPFQQRGGLRQLWLKSGKLQLRQGEDAPLEFELRGPRS